MSALRKKAVLSHMFLLPEKKARSFDFLAMFQEAKATAIDRSKETLGMSFPLRYFPLYNFIVEDISMVLYLLSASTYI